MLSRSSQPHPYEHPHHDELSLESAPPLSRADLTVKAAELVQCKPGPWKFNFLQMFISQTPFSSCLLILLFLSSF